MKKCKICNTEFDNNPFIYCDYCMEIENAIIKRLRAGNLKRADEKRLIKVLTILRQED